MKPVYQTILNPPNGNCMQACVASILELSLDEVPNFTMFDDFGKAINDYLKQFGMFHVCITAEIGVTFPGYQIISGKSPRNPEILHATVGLNGKIVHDPYPAKNEKHISLLSVDYYELFCLDMTAPKKHGICSKAICPECHSEMPLGAVLCDGCMELHRYV